MALVNHTGPGRRRSQVDKDLGKVTVTLKPEEIEAAAVATKNIKNGNGNKARAIILSPQVNKRLGHAKRTKINHHLKPDTKKDEEELFIRLKTTFESFKDSPDGGKIITYRLTIPTLSGTKYKAI